MDRATTACPDHRTRTPDGVVPRDVAPLGARLARRTLAALTAATCLAGALGAPAPLSAAEPGRAAGRPAPAVAGPPSEPGLRSVQMPLPVQGAPGGAMCGERRQVVSRLAEKYGETRRGYGLQQGAAVVEVYASGDTGSWTILLSTPNGLACLLAAGQNWAPTPEEAAAAVGDPT